MKLTPAELTYVRSMGVYITDKCDGCGMLLNQTVRYAITGVRGVYCSVACRDVAFFEGDPHEAKKHASPGHCAYCGAALTGKKRGALYCGPKCRMRATRTVLRMATASIEKSRTASQSNQGVANAKMLGPGIRIASHNRRARRQADAIQPTQSASRAPGSSPAQAGR